MYTIFQSSDEIKIQLYYLRTIKNYTKDLFTKMFANVSGRFQLNTNCLQQLQICEWTWLNVKCLLETSVCHSMIPYSVCVDNCATPACMNSYKHAHAYTSMNTYPKQRRQPSCYNLMGHRIKRKIALGTTCLLSNFRHVSLNSDALDSSVDITVDLRMCCQMLYAVYWQRLIFDKTTFKNSIACIVLF